MPNEITIDVKNLQGKSVLFLIPLHYPNIDYNCLSAINREALLLERLGVPCSVLFATGDSLIQRQRCNLATHFYNQKQFTHSMWVDGDINFKEGAVVTMLAANQPIIGGAYPLKRLYASRIRAAVEAGVNDENLFKYATKTTAQDLVGSDGTTIKLNEPFPIKLLATGFLMVAREVYDAFVSAEPDAWFYTGADIGATKVYEFFKCPREEGVLLSEDYYFCRKASELGFTPMLAPWVELSHVGSFIYEGDFFRSCGVYFDEEKIKKEENKNEG